MHRFSSTGTFEFHHHKDTNYNDNDDLQRFIIHRLIRYDDEDDDCIYDDDDFGGDDDYKKNCNFTTFYRRTQTCPSIDFLESIIFISSNLPD